MILRKFNPVVFQFAPGFLGAFFLAAILPSCRKEKKIPDWQAIAPGTAGERQPASPVSPPAAPRSVATDPAARIRFVTYNVENWLTMERAVNGAAAPGREKPEKERRAVIEMILAARPDILGVCELGGEAEVAEIQQRLTNAGLSMRYHIVIGGADPTRHLGLISKYPIEPPIAHPHLGYSSFGKSYEMQRGILDAVVDTPAGPVRFVGVHLKSKRDVAGEDQEEMRRNEAHLLRRELDVILEADPAARLVVYGDMNDTRQSPSIRTIQGLEKGSKSLTIAPLKDSRGESWTQHWDYQEIYSRIDYVMLSSSLRSSLVGAESRVMDEPAWSAASDHRPLLVVLKNLN